MKTLLRLAVALASLSAAIPNAHAQDASPGGAQIYKERCARCHGSNARNLANKKMHLPDTGNVHLGSGRPLAEFLTAHQVPKEQDQQALTAYFKTLLTATPK